MPATEEVDTLRTVETTPRATAPDHAGVTEEPLDPVALETSVVSPACGAALTFTGIVRNHDPEATGTVTSLAYSAHPDAGALLAEIVARHVRGPEDPGGEVRVAAAHRIGHLDVGDLALVVSVASAHRAEAFEVCRAVVEDIKAEVPIWKKQQTATGEAHWVGLP
ncbi:molybdenum cofactor biosynthesis protein MoaE [Citricoccus sp.]|uniref:molybdenum cofactor biosynthesis protein MoaE n=1 Tax=Citricoccus sp. TaxID=1978372 RepID=UPI0028BD9639|nr:molybdenum cofactor biosynthesis protein MoaE [Citricoccus sp.]